MQTLSMHLPHTRSIHMSTTAVPLPTASSLHVRPPPPHHPTRPMPPPISHQHLRTEAYGTRSLGLSTVALRPAAAAVGTAARPPAPAPCAPRPATAAGRQPPPQPARDEPPATGERTWGMLEVVSKKVVLDTYHLAAAKGAPPSARSLRICHAETKAGGPMRTSG